MSENYTIQLADHIAQKILLEAQRLGITQTEWLHYIIGRECSNIGNYVSGFSPIPVPTVPPPQAIPSDFIDSLIMGTRAAAATTGQLTCRSCMSRLTVTEVKQGSCSKCEAPIE